MQDEFERIMEFFDLSAEEKEVRLKEVFEDSVEYFERFKYVMLNGTPEEKKKAVERVMILKKKIEEETQRVCEKTGMTPDQLAAYSNDPENFTEEQWAAIEESKKKLDSGVNDLKKEAQAKAGNKTASKKTTSSTSKAGEPPKKRRKKPKNWMPS